ncbi:MAG: CHAT domain-containing protein [Myxococcales bacterium]|nr:CHAT domain-containing protein [Myxococcales bacterium]
MRSLWPTTALLAAACSEPAPAPPPAEAPLAVWMAGCTAVLDGPICELDGPGRLTLWIEGDRPTRFAGQTGPEPACAPADGGWRCVVEVPTSGELEVERASATRLERWRLPLAVSARPPAVVAAEAERRQQPEAARARIEAALPGLSGGDRGLALLTLGRVVRAQGQVEEAVRLLAEASTLLHAGGQVSAATEADGVRAYTLANQLFRLSQAEEAAQVPDAAVYAPGIATVGVYRAQVARTAGDLRGALRAFSTPEQVAARLGMDALARVIQSERAGVLHEMGRHDEALALLAAAAEAEVAPCRRASILNNQAVVLASLGGPEALERGLAVATTALGLVAGCPDVDSRVRLALTTADVELRLGRVEAAAARVAAVNPENRRVALWRGLLDARIQVARGAYDAAVAGFRRLAADAEARGLIELRHRAEVGAGRALAAAGQADAALAAFEQAGRTLTELFYRVPVGEGREAFLGDRDEGAHAHAALLLDLGRPAEALAVARTARAQALAALQRPARIGALSEEARRRWLAAIGEHQRLKAELEADDWSLTAAQRAERAAERPALELRLKVALDEAYSALPAGVATPTPPPLAPGEALLLVQAAEAGWLVFFADAAGVEGRLAPPVAASADPATLVATFLAPFEARVLAARRLRLLLPGALAARDWHALPLGEGPLAAQIEVVYALDLPEDSREAAGDRLVVADPRGDLAGARATGEALGHEAGTRLLLGDGARRAAVLAALPAADAFVYAGHGDFVGDGWSSHLRLAGQDTLAAGDLLLLPRVPRLAVLAGCETSVAPDHGSVPGMSLAHAFAIAGSEAVVATHRPIADESSTRFVASLEAARRGEAGGDVVRALHMAARQHAGDLDWAAWRAVVR